MLIQHVPAAPLDAFVALLWASERGTLPHARGRQLPTGCVDIVVPLHDGTPITRFDGDDDLAGRRFHGAIVQGAHDRAVLRGVEGPSAAVGVHFRPGGAAALLGGALPELRNRTVALDDLWARPRATCGAGCRTPRRPVNACAAWSASCCNGWPAPASTHW